ncbi:hypothetical protein A2U01_0066107, partial [Trifolium medium]|nr:hypothetical protein [Trifolium medium]
QISDDAVRIGCIFPFLLIRFTTEHQYLSPELFAATTLALYAAAFVMLVLVFFVPEVEFRAPPWLLLVPTSDRGFFLSRFGLISEM